MEDDDQYFEMEAEGQLIEFHSEEDADGSRVEGRGGTGTVGNALSSG